MDKGYLILAVGDEYIIQACLCAMSIKCTQQISNVSLVTDTAVPKKYKKLFDKIIDVPWVEEQRYAIDHRWKLYHVSPYEQTVVLDSDMLFVTDVSHYWRLLENYDLYFTNQVETYRDQKVTSNYYREAFIVNSLPNVYFGYHYFKKSELALEFYKMLELITNNWELFYGKFVPKKYPKQPSMDITASIAVKILAIEEKVTNHKINIPTFTHMKSKAQNWRQESFNWQDRVPYTVTDNLDFYIGNFRQNGILHYTENHFVTNDLIEKYERVTDVS
jgi:hypothetical protein